MSKGKSELLASLNEEQRRAAGHIGGPLLVLAGAGTGKTRVVTHRIANLLANGVAPRNILALTFTRKAGVEMQERVADLVGDRSQEMRISTFHSLGLSIIRQNRAVLGLPKDFGICETERQRKIAKIVFEQMDDVPGKPRDVVEFLDAVSQSKNLLGPVDDNLATAIEDYDSRLRVEKLIDFDDMVRLSLGVLEGSRKVRASYQRRFQHILVDEYQDTNAMQFRLLNCLVGSQRNLFAVGDDDQSIYGFRGADRRIILRFGNDFQASKLCKLTRNYRCSEEVVRVANAVISESKGRYQKRLKPTLGSGGPVVLKRLAHENAEGDFIAKGIHALRGKTPFDDIAVLVRMNSQGKEMRGHLKRHGIPTDGTEGVRVMTLHAAKGLEFPTVFLPGIEDDSLPSWGAAKSGQTAVEEERRLFYVGITRAKQRLTMTYCKRRGSHKREPSRFLNGLQSKGLVSSSH